MSENTDRSERMTVTPSKDRAEAHMDRAARIIETMAFDVDAVRRNDQERAQRLIASCLATSQDEGFAEGMKRAAEIARMFDDRSDILKISGWGVSKAILSEAERR